MEIDKMRWREKKKKRRRRGVECKSAGFWHRKAGCRASLKCKLTPNLFSALPRRNEITAFCRASFPTCQSSHNSLSQYSLCSSSFYIAFSLSLLLPDSGCQIWITHRKIFIYFFPVFLVRVDVLH